MMNNDEWASNDDLTLEFPHFSQNQQIHSETTNTESCQNPSNPLNEDITDFPSKILENDFNNLSRDSDNNWDNQMAINDIIEEDLQWNEQTWVYQTQSNTKDTLHVFDHSNTSENHTHMLESTDLDFSTFTPRTEDKVPETAHHGQPSFRNNNTSHTVDPKDDNQTFYGLPLRVKSLLQRVKNVTSLYSWQDECLNLEAVKKRKNLIYALPTSGGKTLVAEILMLKEVVCNRKNVIFVLPYVAIVQEKIQSMAPFALDLEFLLEEYTGGKGQYPPVKRRRKNSIYICTIEKAAGLLNSLIELNRLPEVGLVVIDELHLIGETGGRGATLEGLLTKLMYANENIHIVGMSATIGNLAEVAEFLKADLYTQNFRPVELKEYVKCGDDIWLVDVHNEEVLTERKKINYKYSETKSQLDPDRIGGLVMDVVPKDSCLIFCSSKKNCENVALLLTRVLFRSLMEYRAEAKAKLLTDLKAEEGSVCPILSKTIQYGVAYHHSGLTAEERRMLEDAYRENTLCVICCTSTLAAGVNLPARRVILRTPYMGNEFLNLGRYKQMIGRAGRAGMGEIGESIVLCKAPELPKVRELLTSKMDDCTSTLISEQDRGINNLILTSVLLSLATTRAKLRELVSFSLLGVQSSKLNVNIKKETDQAIVKLIKSQILKVQAKPHYNPNMTVALESQIPQDLGTVGVDNVLPKTVKQTVTLSATGVVKLSDLGRAAMKGCIDLQTAFVLYEDLKIAQKHLMLLNDLHMLYLVTPYDLANQIKPIGSVYFDRINALSSAQMAVARVLGIDEVVIMKIRDGTTSKSIEPRVIQRFYVTLILYDLWRQQPLYIVAQKYRVNRGIIQNLMSSSSSFAISAVRFCKEIPEFWAFAELYSSFGKKLNHFSSAELELLMELPAVKIGRARQLHNAGYKTLQSIVSADSSDLQEQLKNVSKKTIDRIIAAAHVLLLAKVENLKDEAAEMMEGLDQPL